jgi:hypothetical protein
MYILSPARKCHSLPDGVIRLAVLDMYILSPTINFPLNFQRKISTKNKRYKMDEDKYTFKTLRYPRFQALGDDHGIEMTTIIIIIIIIITSSYL